MCIVRERFPANCEYLPPGSACGGAKTLWLILLLLVVNSREELNHRGFSHIIPWRRFTGRRF